MGLKDVHIIDGSWLCYVGLFSQRNLSANGIKTGGTYHMLKTLLKIKREHPGDLIYLVLDGENGKEERLNLYPGYKGGRRKDISKSEFQINIDCVMFISSLIKDTIVIKDKNAEADDVICSIMKNYNAFPDTAKIHIYGTDKDFYQAASSKTIFHSKKEDKTMEDIEKYFGLKIKDLLLYRAARGDSSDNIPAALPRIQHKTLISEIINNYPDNIPTNTKWGKLFHDNKKQFELNLKLMRYKHVSLTKDNIVGGYNFYPKEKAVDLLDKLALKYIKKQLEEINYDKKW